MPRFFRAELRDALRRFLRERVSKPVLDAVRASVEHVTYPQDFSASDVSLCEAVFPYTMASAERIASLAEMARYVVRARLPGAIVECGVWRGGSMMTIARTLLDLGATDRHLYLFDTYEGMSAPTERDRDLWSRSASDLLARSGARKRSDSVWSLATEEEVRANMEKTGYPMERVHLVRGKVEDTLPRAAPESIALLRLDTDWYESTLHELRELYPRLVRGGVLVIDDYGYWQGARQATDEYFEAQEARPFLHRVDFTCRTCVKP